MADIETGEDQDLSRFGGFMDGVFAIAITLPIVQLTPPTVAPGRDLAAAYRSLKPEFVSYMLGFIVIRLFWNYSHFSSKLLRRTDHGFNLLTIQTKAARPPAGGHSFCRVSAVTEHFPMWCLWSP